MSVRTTIHTVEFKSVLDAYSTDTIEIDFRHAEARLVNSAGKIKATTKFTVHGYPEQENGAQVTAG